MSSVPKRQCKICGNVYPRSRVHFHKNKSMPDGYDTSCKKCRMNPFKWWTESSTECYEIGTIKELNDEKVFFPNCDQCPIYLQELMETACHMSFAVQSLLTRYGPPKVESTRAKIERSYEDRDSEGRG
jgi:hypothetical protein